MQLLKESQTIKEELRTQLGNCDCTNKEALYNLSETKEQMLKDAVKTGIMYDNELDSDIRSLQQTIIYGLKGISAYGHQAGALNYEDDAVDDFYFTALAATCDQNLSVEDLIALT